MTAPVWLNGAVVPAAAARIDPADRGFTLGDGVFETIAVRGGTPCRLEAHLARLARGMALLGLTCPWPIEAAISDLLASAAMRDGVLRLTLSRGVAARGLWPATMDRPTLLLTLAPPAAATSQARLVLCRGTRRNQNSPLCQIKSLNYLDNVLARAEAAASGADDAIVCNTRGAIAGASAANLIIEHQGRWLTPRLRDGALPGTVRQCLLAAGLIAEATMWPKTLHAASAMMLTNSLGITQACRFEGRALATRDDFRRRLLAVAE